MAKAALFDSRRGQGGGFEISQLGRGASILDVVEAIDGPIRLNVCLCAGKVCIRKVWCPVHPVWAQAQRAIFDVLTATRIRDLAEQGAANQFTTIVTPFIAPVANPIAN
jgi:DNA-binding IscR family transcriptional regulator